MRREQLESIVDIERAAWYARLALGLPSCNAEELPSASLFVEPQADLALAS